MRQNKYVLTIYNSGKDKLIKAIHKEINVLFGINPPEPDEVFFHYWENGCHFWDVGADMNEVYGKIMKPIDDKELYICGESFSKKQAWMEGSLETCYDVMKKLNSQNYLNDRKVAGTEGGATIITQNNIINNARTNAGFGGVGTT